MEDVDLHKKSLFLGTAKLLAMKENGEKQNEEASRLLETLRDLVNGMSESTATPPIRITVEIRVEDESPQMREMLTNYLFLKDFWRKRMSCCHECPKKPVE